MVGVMVVVKLYGGNGWWCTVTGGDQVEFEGGCNGG